MSSIFVARYRSSIRDLVSSLEPWNFSVSSAIPVGMSSQPCGVASRRIPQQRGVLGADRIELSTRLSMQLDAEGANDLENGVDPGASVT